VVKDRFEYYRWLALIADPTDTENPGGQSGSVCPDKMQTTKMTTMTMAMTTTFASCHLSPPVSIKLQRLIHSGECLFDIFRTSTLCWTFFQLFIPIQNQHIPTTLSYHVLAIRIAYISSSKLNNHGVLLSAAKHNWKKYVPLHLWL
jgi:hypothetical protein